jgi:hypothetical protein
MIRIRISMIIINILMLEVINIELTKDSTITASRFTFHSVEEESNINDLLLLIKILCSIKYCTSERLTIFYSKKAKLAFWKAKRCAFRKEAFGARSLLLRSQQKRSFHSTALKIENLQSTHSNISSALSTVISYIKMSLKG